MADDKKDMLSQYKGKEYPPLEKKVQTPQLVKEQIDYLAIEEFKANKLPRFRIVDAEGKSYGCSYAHLLDWVYEPPALLTITTATRIFTLQGKRLGRIDDLLAEGKIKRLTVFNEKRFKAVATNKTTIESLEIIEI